MNLPKILVVDDRKFDRILYTEYLGNDNYVFHELDDGEHIIKAIQEFQPNLILLDWQMPRVGGLEALKMVKKNQAFKEIPIIIITGLEDENVLEEAFDYGSIDFLNKPVSSIELNARVLNAIRLKEAIQTVVKQKDELKTLSEIIKAQKNELEKSLELKTEKMNNDRDNFQNNLEEKNRKLITKELDSTKFINDIKSIRTRLTECYNTLKSEGSESPVLRKLLSIDREIENIGIKDNNWSDFKETFESIDPAFYEKLATINPRLTPLDLKNCAYIKLNLDNYEVSKILNIELKSLQMTRYRLKKKLKINENVQLREFIHSI